MMGAPALGLLSSPPSFHALSNTYATFFFLQPKFLTMNNLHTPVKACLRSASCEVNHFRKVRSLHRRWHNPTTFRHLRKIVLPAFLLPSFNLGNSLSYPRLQPTGTLLNPYDATPRYRRQFTTLRAFQAVAVTANPRKDEDGKDMIIDITPRAANVRLCHLSISAKMRLTLHLAPS